MKVEFTDLNPWGPALVIEYKEFIKGKDEGEFESLQRATDAFFSLFGLDYYVAKDEYDLVLNWMEKDGIAFLIIFETNYPYNKWPELWVSNNNRPHQVVYFSNGQRMLSGKFNPNAIKKRHEVMNNE